MKWYQKIFGGVLLAVVLIAWLAVGLSVLGYVKHGVQLLVA